MIDLNRGCTIRLHPQGFRVIMYKDSPGEYLDASGREMSPDVARSAGFDVDHDLRESQKLARMAEMREQIEREFAAKEREVTEILNAAADGKTFTVKHVGASKYAIFDQDDKRFTNRAMTKDEAASLLRDLVGAPVEKSPFEGMDKRALEAHAKEKFGIDLDLRTFNTEEKIIAEIERLAAKTDGGKDDGAQT